MKSKGQEAIELVLLSVLLFFASLSVLSIFSDTIKDFFTKSSSLFASTNKNKIITTETQTMFPAIEQYRPWSEQLTNQLSSEIIDIQGHDVLIEPDGTSSLYLDDQELVLSPDFMDLNNTVMQTNGSSGLKRIIPEIVYLLKKNKDKYPPGQVPLEISFGSGLRLAKNKHNDSYSGNVDLNTATIKVGNDIVIIQVDQTCIRGDKDQTCAMKGIYRIEGSIDKNNKFEGDVSVKVTQPGYEHTTGVGAYSAFVDTSNGLRFTKGKTNLNVGHYKNQNYNWDIVSNSSKSFHYFK